MRDCQILFQPYTSTDIQDIIEMKKNSIISQVKQMGSSEVENQLIKKVFFRMVNMDAVTYMAKQIAQSSGDIRVAFDIIKNALQSLLKKADQIEDHDYSVPQNPKEVMEHRLLKESALVIDMDLICKILD